MKYIYYIIPIIFIILLGCFQKPEKLINNKLNKMNDSIFFFEDFDFSTFKGINPIKKYESPAFLEIIANNKDSLVLKIYQKEIIPEIYSIYDEEGNCTNCPKKYNEFFEVFKKKGSYYYQFEDIPEDDAGVTVHIYKYFNCSKKEIIMIDLLMENSAPSSYEITKISLNTKQKETISFLGKWSKDDVLKSNLDFEALKNDTKAYNYYVYNYETQKRGLAVKHIFENLREKKINIGCDLYRGFPSKKVNIYWNLYRGYFGSNVDNEFDNCE